MVERRLVGVRWCVLLRLCCVRLLIRILVYRGRPAPRVYEIIIADILLDIAMTIIFLHFVSSVKWVEKVDIT